LKYNTYVKLMYGGSWFQVLWVHCFITISQSASKDQFS